MIKSGKDYLEWVSERLEYISDKIDYLTDSKDDIMIDMSAVRSPSMGERVQTTPNGDVLADKITRIEEIDEQIDSLKLQRVKTKSHARDYLVMLKNDQLRNCLWDRHIRFMSNSEIALKEGITERGLRKRFVRAYRCFDGIYSLENIRKIQKSVDSSTLE